MISIFLNLIIVDKNKVGAVRRRYFNTPDFMNNLGHASTGVEK